MILDAYWCADGVWRVPPATINQARAREGIDSVPGPDFDLFEFINNRPVDYIELARRFYGLSEIPPES